VGQSGQMMRVSSEGKKLDEKKKVVIVKSQKSQEWLYTVL